MNKALLGLLIALTALPVRAADVIVQAESMVRTGSYASLINTPFPGVAFYGNNDGATGSADFAALPGQYLVEVRGASNNSNSAGIALSLDAVEVAAFSFTGTAATTQSTIVTLTGGPVTKPIRLLLKTDNGSSDTYVDWIGFTYLGAPPPPRPAPVLPAQGSFYTGVYRNLFVESGHDATSVTQKLKQMWNQYFVDGDANTGRLYYTVGTDMAYILDTGNNDIRSEGMSYGMMIALQMDKKEAFDKLWKFAKTHTQHPPGDARQGLFAWQLNRSTFSKMDANSAPDGELYFATALFFAHARWGSGDGIFNYKAEANYILDNMLNKPAAGSGACPSSLVDLMRSQIVFGICGNSSTFTDPSYHLAAFFEYWAIYADNNQDFWLDMADTSRRHLLPAAAHPVTGLMPDYSTFDGAPVNEGTHGNFEYDAWRNIMNMSFDFSWFRRDGSYLVPLIDRQINFFKDKPNYDAIWTLNGSSSRVTGHSPGLVACNAVAALALEDAKVWPFVDEIFTTGIPSGQYRYYDGLLYMMSYMHLAGEYRAWKPSTEIVPVMGVTLTPETLSLHVGQASSLTATVSPSNAANKNVVYESDATAVATVDSSGRVTALAEGTATITGSTLDGGFTDTTSVTVAAALPPPPVTSVSVAPSSVALYIGGSQTLTATVLPADAANKNVTWHSDDTDIATVSTGGTVTGIAAGVAVITATTEDGNLTSTTQITVTTPPTVPEGSASWNLDGNGNWNTSANWTPATVPGAANTTGDQDTAIFGNVITADRAISAASNWSIKHFIFNASHRYAISGGNLRLSADGTAEILATSVGSAVISSNNALYGNYTFLSNGAAASTLTFGNGNIGTEANLGPISLTIGGAGTGSLTAPNLVNGPISQSSGTTLRVVKEGSSTWAIGASGGSTYTGGVRIKEGTLIVQSNNAALGTTGSSVTLGDSATGQNATLHIGTGRSIANPLTVDSGAGLRTLSHNATSGGSGAYSGAITLAKALLVSQAGSQGFTVSGATTGTGDLTFETSSSGGLTVSASINPLGAVGHTGAGAGALTVSGALGTNVTSFTQNAVSATTLQSAANAFGETFVTRGTLATNATGKLGSGAVTVGGGELPATLTLGNSASLANTADLTFHANATINLNYSGAMTIGALRFADGPQLNTLGTYTAAQLNSAFGVTLFTGTGSLAITALVSVPEPASPFEAWSVANGLDGIDGRDPSPDADPDHDGLSNLLEYALDGDALVSDHGLTHVRRLSIGGSDYLTLTVAIRTGALFSGASAQVSAPIDGITYTIQGSTDLVAWGSVVAEATGAEVDALHDSLPAPFTGWTYRTFRPASSIAQTPHAFLRVLVEWDVASARPDLASPGGTF